jgi:hypothetical protein
MSKILIIAGIILAIAIGVFLFGSAISTDQAQPSNQLGDTELPIQNNENGMMPAISDFESSVENGSLAVTNGNGQREEIAFLGNVSQDEEVLADGFSLLFETDPNASYFDIMYDRPSGSITIYLHELPLSFARNLAISRLTDSLQVTTSDLCNLNVSVQTNVFVDSTYAGVELGVPGCPGAVNLPI